MYFTTKAQTEALKALDAGHKVRYADTEAGVLLLPDIYHFVIIAPSMFFLDRAQLTESQGIAKSQTAAALGESVPAELTTTRRKLEKSTAAVFMVNGEEVLLNEKFLKLAPVHYWTFYRSCLYGWDAAGVLLCGAMCIDPRHAKGAKV